MELKTVDPMAWVKARPERFFRDGKPDAVALLAYLMEDVLELGAGSCTIRRADSWWIIGSDDDWLRNDVHTETSLFAHVIAAPQHGEHSMRGEILVSAFAKSVWTTLDEQRTRIQGDDLPPRVRDSLAGLHRAIAFEM